MCDMRESSFEVLMGLVDLDGPEIIRPVTLSPQDCQVLLDSSAGNRPINQSHVLYLAEQIDAGNWGLSSNAICVNSAGQLWEGHHRCHACLLANKPIRTLFGVNMPDDTNSVDAGSKVLQWSTRDIAHREGVKASHTEIAVARAINNWPAKMTRRQEYVMLMRHYKAIHFVCGQFPNQCKIPSSTVAPAAKAYYHANHHLLSRFIQVVTGTDAPRTSAEMTAFHFRNRMVAFANSRTQLDKKVAFSKATSCLKAYLEGREIKIFYECENPHALWPLPEHETEDCEHEHKLFSA